MKCDVMSLDNKKVGDIDLPDAIFGVKARCDILARTVHWQLNKRRQGTHATKDRGWVSGTTKKAFRQKGTGRARQGTHRAPQHRHGGIVFGPLPRSHATDLPKKVRRLALKMALSAKQADGKLVVLEDAKFEKARTAELVKRIKKLGWGTALLIDGAEVDANLLRAAGNIVGFDVLPTQGANVYDILRKDTLVLTRAAVAKLQERLQ
jgi:large subunit ribosomal protein L4